MEQRVISFHYELKNKSGELLDSSHDGDPMTFIEGKGEIIVGLETALKSLKKGDKKHIPVTASQAYGTYEKDLKLTLPIDQFPQDEKVEMGDQFRMKAPDSEVRIFTVVHLTPSEVTVDGNHPLAGQDLFFDVEITEARIATPADLEKADACCDHDHDHDHGDGHGSKHQH